METKIIAMFNNKGGVGKTTATLMFSQLLARRGKMVLLIDLDPQGNLTSQFESIEVSNNTSNELLLEDVTLKDCIRTYKDKELQLDYVPSNAYLNKANNLMLMETMSKNPATRLRTKIINEVSDYDFVLIDMNPSIDLLTTNALSVAHDVIVPTKADKFSISGLNILMETINEVRDEYNQDLHLRGIFLNEYVRSNVYKDCYELLQNLDEFMNTKISSAVSVKENTMNDGLYINNKMNPKIENEYEELLFEVGYYE